MQFQQAKRGTRVPKILLGGPAGGGKTLSSLKLLTGLIGKDKTIVLLDSENGSATIYADRYNFLHGNIEKSDQTVSGYIKAMSAALEAGAQGLIVDGITPVWQAILDKSASMEGNSFTNWSKLTPLYQQFIQFIIDFPIPLICTSRSKQSYVLEENSQGKMVPKKVGLELVSGKDIDYEFDMVFRIDQKTHSAIIDKCRYAELDQYFVERAGEVQLDEEVGTVIRKIVKGEKIK